MGLEHDDNGCEKGDEHEKNTNPKETESWHHEQSRQHDQRKGDSEATEWEHGVRSAGGSPAWGRPRRIEPVGPIHPDAPEMRRFEM